MNFIELAKQRYSTRKYQEKPVEIEKLTEILESGRIAPSAANFQPCFFLVLNTAKSLGKLDKACSAHGAPLAILVCTDKNVAWVRPFDKVSMVEVDSTIAADHIMFAAQDLGLSSCWITYFDPAVVKKEFLIPEHLVPVNILAIGYGADCPQSPERHDKTRKPLSEIVRYGSF